MTRQFFFTRKPLLSLLVGTCIPVFAAMQSTIAANAQQPVHIPQARINYEEGPRVSLPLVICWHDGTKVLYIQTDASDSTVAAQQGVNLVPRLSNAVDAPGGAVDDIYVFTNSTEKDQYNILPSAPQPVGPNKYKHQLYFCEPLPRGC